MLYQYKFLTIVWPTSIIVVPAYLNGDVGNYLKHKGKLTISEVSVLLESLSCGLYELHRSSEGIENPKPRMVHRLVKHSKKNQSPRADHGYIVVTS